MPEMPAIPPWDMVRPLLLAAVLPAFALAAFVTLALLLIAGRKGATLATALGIGVSAGLGLWLRGPLTLLTVDATPWTATSDIDFWLSGSLKLEDADSRWNYLPWAALAALWIGRIARMTDVPVAAGWFLRAAVSAGTAWLIIPFEIRKDVDWLVPAFAAVVLANWALLEFLAAGQTTVDVPQKPGRVEPDLRTGSGGVIALLVALALFTAGTVSVHAHTARLMEAAFVVGAAYVGVALVAALCQADTGGAIPAAAVLLPGLSLMTHQTTFSEIPWYAFALPAFAPLLLAETLPLRRWHGFPLYLTRVLLVLVPLAAALFLAHWYEPMSFEPEWD